MINTPGLYSCIVPFSVFPMPPLPLEKSLHQMYLVLWCNPEVEGFLLEWCEFHGTLPQQYRMSLSMSSGAWDLRGPPGSKSDSSCEWCKNNERDRTGFVVGGGERRISLGWYRLPISIAFRIQDLYALQIEMDTKLVQGSSSGLYIICSNS